MAGCTRYGRLFSFADAAVMLTHATQRTMQLNSMHGRILAMAWPYALAHVSPSPLEAGLHVLSAGPRSSGTCLNSPQPRFRARAGFNGCCSGSPCLAVVHEGLIRRIAGEMRDSSAAGPPLASKPRRGYHKDTHFRLSLSLG